MSQTLGLFNGISLAPGYSMVGPLGFSGVLPGSYTQGSDEFWMHSALSEALLGSGTTNPNPAVGCVIVDRAGVEMSRGFTQPYRDIHAERHALRNLSSPEKLEGATAYVTLEPCSHQGHQPPCVDLFLRAPFSRVVIATQDVNVLVNGGGIEVLRAAGKKVEIGLFRNEVRAWNFLFFAQHLLHRPVVTLICKESLDEFKGSEPHVQDYLTRLFRKHDVIIEQNSDTLCLKYSGRTLTVEITKEVVQEVGKWLSGTQFVEQCRRPLQSVLWLVSAKIQEEIIRGGPVDAIHELYGRSSDHYLIPESIKRNFRRIAHFKLNNVLVTEWVSAQLF